MSDLLELAKRCEAATGPDRELDVIIAQAVWPQLTRYAPHCSGEEPIFWDDPFRKRRCPEFTTSLDAALMLVPDGWYWRCGKTTSFQAWAVVNRTHPDHCEPNRDEFFANRENWDPVWTPVLALCTAALRARAALAEAPSSGATT